MREREWKGSGCRVEKGRGGREKGERIDKIAEGEKRSSLFGSRSDFESLIWV